jgi:hypothetical protein
MKKLYALPGIILSIAFLASMFFLVSKSSGEAEKFKESKSQVAKILNFNDRLLSAREWMFSEKAWSEKKAEMDAAVAQADVHHTKAKSYGYYILYSCLGFLLIIGLIYMKRRLFFGLTMALIMISVALLAEGVSSPILEMGAFKEELTIKVYVKPRDIPYFEEAVAYMGKISDIADYIKYVPIYGEEWAEGAQGLVTEGQEYLKDNADSDYGVDKVFQGRTYFYYQNKGIMDVIGLLWNNNNKPVAAAIGTFSVIIPAIKLMLTFLILILPITGWKRIRKALTFISKYSMADVFVVAAFLAYLSFANMSPGVQMEANVLYGLYYFGGYVLISVALGMFLNKSIEEKQRNLDTEDNTNDGNSDPIEGSQNPIEA